jgi:hypothetical protein
MTFPTAASTAMAKPIPKLKPKAHVQRKVHSEKLPPTTMISGFDVSMNSIAGAAIAWDYTLRKWKGPEFIIVRWDKDDHYFDRISEAVNGRDLIWGLQSQLKISPELQNVFIAQEEPWPMGLVGRVSKQMSQTLKQQAEISGAFLAGLLRYGFQNIFQINNVQWRQIVAKDLGITIHHTKWNPKDAKLATEFQCRPDKVGKFRAKQWALGYAVREKFHSEIPEWPDLIDRKEGLIPRPEDSKARAVQPDDRYDALAIMTWMVEEWRNLTNYP